MTEDTHPPLLPERDESPAQRADRNWIDILQELRATQAGTQIMTGFLLAVAFQPAFDKLDDLERTVYLCLVSLSAAATLLGIAPVLVHRRLFRHGEKERIVRLGNRILMILLGVVTVIASGVCCLIFDVVVGRTAGIIALCVTAVVAIAGWVLIRVTVKRPR
ncbi:DUF6328 family protein [Microbacterium gorillae]|uniref:DUF6328 family protein n=1 Tax=Microbacterium gorillae TaxID=1231063 RepID=UPI000591341B|nr:DUF6328 family protein [Microbacterium gorillae]